MTYLLTIMVGPAGAGKSTWIKDKCNPQHVISSDQIREDLFGDFRSQQDNFRVFNICHELAYCRLYNRLPTVIDATHLSFRDRNKSIITAFNAGLKTDQIRYVIIDRPLEKKLATQGWRAEVPDLVLKHHNKFQNDLKNILAGDNLGITVIDLRQFS